MLPSFPPALKKAEDHPIASGAALPRALAATRSVTAQPWATST